MLDKFSSKASYFVLTLIIGAIIISFAITGIGLGGSNPTGRVDAVATVDGTPVSMKEYQQALGRQLQFYSQFSGGKPLTTQQIERFNIKQTVLQNLVQQKLFLNLAKKIQLDHGSGELKDEIKKMEYFKSNGVFNVELYKRILAQNGHSTHDFEELVSSDLSLRSIYELINKNFISEGLIKSFHRYKQNKLKASAVVLNDVQILNSFDSKLKDDEKRIKLEALKKQVRALIKSGNNKKLTALSKKHKFQYVSKGDINLYDLNIGAINLDETKASEIFKTANSTNQVFSYTLSGNEYLIRYKKNPSKVKAEDQLKAEISSKKQEFAQILRQELTTKLQEKAKIRTYPSRL